MLLLLALVIVMIGNIIKFKSCKETPSNIIMHNQILKKTATNRANASNKTTLCC